MNRLTNEIVLQSVEKKGVFIDSNKTSTEEG